jgi:hypothetical protein
VIDHFTFFFFRKSTKYHSWHKNCFLCSSFCQPFHTSIWHSLNFFTRFLSFPHFKGYMWTELFLLPPRTHSLSLSWKSLTNEGEHKSKFITNYYSWFWNIYSFLCKPNIIDTSILMFFLLHVARSFIGMMEWSAMMKNDFVEARWRDYTYKLKCFKWENNGRMNGDCDASGGGVKNVSGSWKRWKLSNKRLR